MLKFFRRIRRALLDEGRLRKYLVYAIGEILLVMIGILLALKINNWNEERTNHRTEVQYLTNVLNELQQDSRLMERLVLNRYQRKIEGLQLAQAYARGSYEVEDTLKFLTDVSFGAVFANGIEFLNSSTFNELVSTGNLQLISNDSLKNAINGYYDFVERQIVNIRYYTTDYIHYINSMRAFDPSNPDTIDALSRELMMRKLKSEETILKANLEITYGNRVYSLVKGMSVRAKELVGFIQRELNGEK